MSAELPKSIRASDLLEIWTDTEDDTDEGLVSCCFEFDALNEDTGLEFLEELARRYNAHQQLIAALEKFGSHTEDCDIHGKTRGSSLKCDCGWDAQEAALLSARGGGE